MTQTISRLLTNAARAAAANGGVVPTDYAMKLASEGYDLDQLDADVEQMLYA